MKKFGTIFLAFLAIIVFASWQYRLLCLLLIVIINRKWLQEKLNAHWAHTYRTLVIVMAVLIFACLPNYWQRGRTQLHYLEQQGQTTNTPILPYLANCIFPEKEVMNLCYKTVAILPVEQMKLKIAGKSYRIGNKLVSDAHEDFWRGRAVGFYNAYNHLYLSGSNPGSFVYGQVCNQLFNLSYDAIYITKPKHYDKEKIYPLVIFCHGYMGSWELYQGILNGLDDCIVMSIGTKGLDGLSFKIKDIFTKYVPYLQSIGYKIDQNQLHLMGLSNGGQASNVALRDYSTNFKTIAFISTPCYVINNSHAKVLLIGGGRDGSAIGQPSAAKKLRQKKANVASMYYPDENHYIFATQRREMIRFLNKQLH